MRSKKEIFDKIKELEIEYNLCFHAVKCKRLTENIKLLNWVLKNE